MKMSGLRKVEMSGLEVCMPQFDVSRDGDDENDGSGGWSRRQTGR